MLSDDEIAALLALNHEVRVAEFKSAGSPAVGPFLAKVARACLAMANKRNGGHVLIGVDDDDPVGGPNGVSDEDMAAWLDFDTVSERINRYADPPLTLEIASRSHPSGNKLVVIEVSEFGDSPVLCKKAFDGILSLGQLYTRSIAKPESSQYHSQAELREVIDIAVEKGLRNFVTRARNAGIELGADDAVRYSKLLDSFLQDTDLQAIRATMYSEMRLRPIPFEPSRIAYEELSMTIQRAQIRRPGATFPLMGYDFEHSQSAITWRRPGRGPVWRFDESGAFVFAGRLRDPGPDFDGLLDRDDPGVEGFVSIRDITAFVTLAVELSVRLMNALDIDDAECELILGGIRGHALVADDPRRTGLLGAYIYHDDSWSQTIDLSAQDRAEDPSLRSAEISLGIFRRFGWSAVTPELVSAIQARVFDL